MAGELEELAEVEKIKAIAVVQLTAEGRPTSYIQSETGVAPARQRQINKEFKSYVQNDMYAETIARELVGYTNEHFGAIVKRFYEAVDEAEQNGDYKNKANILKQIVETEKIRVEMLQKAGVLTAHSVGDDIAQMQAEKAQIIELLKEIAQKHPEAKQSIIQGISRITQETVATQVIGGE
jgi:hypothetical protein